MKSMDNLLDSVDGFMNQDDWRVNENSNAHFSYGSMNKFIAGEVSEEYWKERVYSKDITDAHNKGFFHIHDLAGLSIYCTGYSLKDIIKKGVRGISNIPTSTPAKHFGSLLAQVANLTTIYQNEILGAVAYSNFDTLIAPFVKMDKLSYKEVRQHMQQFIFQINSNSRQGSEPAFSNLTFDLTPDKDMLNKPALVGNIIQDFTYKDCQKEMDMVNRAFYETMIEGDAEGKPFSYPIPTYNIHERFDWENPNNELLWEMSGKYGTPYFANFINSDMDPSQARSMCPIGSKEKVLVKSTRGRGLEFSEIGNIYNGNCKKDIREIYSNGKFVSGRVNKWDNQELIKVTLVNGHSLTMTKTHLNYVMRGKDNIIEELLGSDLLGGFYLPYSLNVYEGNGGNYDFGYLVGAFAGDGTFEGDTEVRFSLSDIKLPVLEKLRNIAVKYFGAECSVSNSDDSRLITLRVNSRAVSGLCREFIGGEKLTKHYKDNLFNMSRKFRQGVLDGHYDTDGDNSYRIYTSSEKMVSCLNMLCSTLGTTTNVTSDDREGRYSENPNYVVRVYQFNGNSYGDIYFKKDDKVWFKIESIEDIQGSVGYCFEVLEDEPVFTVGGSGILTHNCRLRLDKRELLKRNGGLFGSGDKTGSIGVVTINLPRLGYISNQKYAIKESAKKDFYLLLDKYMELAKDSLEIKRWFVNKEIEMGLLPAYKEYVGTTDNHFSTIGLIGMNEMCENLLGVGVDTEEGHDFSVEVLKYMRGRISDFQEETDNLYNLEATPAESTCYRLALKDINEFGNGIVTQVGTNNEPYYTNSCHLPVSKVKNITQLFDHQDELQIQFTGGTVIHNYLDNSVSGDKIKYVLRKLCEGYRVPYISFSPVHSICPTHGFLSGYNDTCPECGQPVESYQRITGYIRQVSRFNLGKKAEFYDRRQLKI